jgi:hypothetical protein
VRFDQQIGLDLKGLLRVHKFSLSVCSEHDAGIARAAGRRGRKWTAFGPFTVISKLNKARCVQETA